MTLTIDPEFQSLIAPLTADEYGELENSLLSEGCRDALVVWNDTLIDGHNRYTICQKHNLPYPVIRREFESREDVIVWMVHNQLARRNIVPFVRSELAGKMKDAIARKAKANQLSGLWQGNQIPVLQNSAKRDEPINTRQQLADIAQVSRDTIAKVEAVLKDAPEPIKQAARAGDISINRAYELTKALKPASPEVKAIVEKHCIDDPDTVDELVRMQSQVKDTFEEVYRSGYVQPGDEPDAVHITHGYKRIKEALKKKSDYHAYEGAITNGTPIMQSSKSNEWYTPVEYIETARRVMGSIDTDPASNDIANQAVQATTYYTLETNGLDKDWSGNVWLNPPYGGLAADFIARLLEQFKGGNVKRAIVLVNSNSTDTKWFQPLWDYTLCFTDGRINFVNPDGEAEPGSTHGSCFIYLGDNPQAFGREFSKFGAVVRRWDWAV